VSNDGIAVDNELKLTWKEVVVAKFQVPFWNIFEGIEGNNE
jgi:hypothetical protein